MRYISNCLILCLLLLVYSCNKHKTINDVNSGNNKVTEALVVKASLPEIKHVSQSNLPQKIVIPVSNLSNYSLNTKDGIKRVNLTSPKSFVPKGGISGGLSHFNTYSTEHGLPLSSIACSYLDKKGNLWFGTYGGGVSKFNGKNFITYNSSHGLANNLVLCVKEDKAGNIWFGTQGGGVSKYDGFKFTTYNILDGLADNVIYNIIEDKKGNLWFASKNGGVSCYNSANTQKKLFKNYNTDNGLAGNTVRTIHEDWHGNIWFGTEGSGVSMFDGSKFINYNTTNGLSNNTIWCITSDKTGALWFGTKGSGVMCYNGKKFVTYDTTNGLANNIVWAIQEDRKGNIWFGTEGSGVSVLDNATNNKSFITYNTTHGLANNVVFCITEDNTGNLWFGTYGGGVSKYNGNSFVTFNSNQGLASNVVFSVNEDKEGNLWFGSYGAGISKYDGKSFTVYNTSQGLANNTVWCITPDRKGNLWLGTYGDGVSKFDGVSFTNYNTTHGLPHNVIRCITEDKNGNLWFGTEGGGVSKFNGESFSNYNTQQGLPHNIVRAIYEDKKGNLWFGTEGGGVCKFDGISFTTYTKQQGLINNVVRSICEDNLGNMWIATQGGLSSIKQSDGNKTDIVNFTSSAGLPDNYVTQVLQYPNGKIVIGTNNGIALFNPEKSLLQNKLVDLELYNNSTNYPVRDVNVGQFAMFIDSKGIIWAGTGDDKTSLVRMDYKAIPKNQEAPRLIINSIKIGEQVIDWFSLKQEYDSITNTQSQMINYGKILSTQDLDSIKHLYSKISFDSVRQFDRTPQNLILPFEHNSVTIEFGALELSRHFMVNYQYMLEGYDKTWSPILKKTEASFGNIYEGAYTFKVRAQSPDGIWSEPISFKFSVEPPVYRTLWAYIFYVIGSIGVLFLFVKWRTNQLQQKQKELELLVDERTHEVTLQKEEAEKQRLIAEHQKDLVQEKQKEIVDSINYAKRIQYALLANDEFLLNNLPNHFVLFKPKDIVSGDFYWATEFEDKFYLAVCDSTGHGVPGAFMSLLNIGYLNEAIREKRICEPNEILNYVRARLIESISKENQQDGMDGVLICFDKKQAAQQKQVIKYAAANNSPVVVSENKFTDFPKDKMPIGKGELTQQFHNYEINLNKGDMLYLYTDGYADQFGGPKGKKFKYRQLNEVLVNCSNLVLEEQKLILDTQFKNWRGDLEQVDDVCVFGIRI